MKGKSTVKLSDAIIAWNPRGDIQVAPLAEIRGTGRFDHLRYTGGGVYSEVKRASHEEAKVLVLALFHDIVVRDKIGVKKVHNVLLAIDEFRDAIAPDAAHTLH